MRSLGASLAGVAARTFTNRSPVPLSSRFTPWTTPLFSQRQEAEDIDLYAANGTLFAIISSLASDVSRVAWKLWRKSASGLPEDRTEVTKHLALDVWNRPNPWMTQQRFVETFQQHVDLAGEGDWLVTTSSMLRGVPLELWPCRPDKILPVPHPEDFISGYMYFGPDGQRIPLKTDEVIQVIWPCPLSLYYGLGPIRSIRTDVEAAQYSSEWSKNFFVNSAHPGGVIQIPSGVRLSDTRFDELADRWSSQHRGVSKAHRIAILEEGEYKSTSFNMRDMQFAEMHGVSKETIREAYCFPKFRMGTVDDVNRATANASEASYSRHLIVARLDRIKDTLNTYFLPRFTGGLTLEFDYVDPTPADSELDAKILTARANAAHVLVTTGFDSTEVLTTVGLPEMKFEKPDPPAVVNPAAPAKKRKSDDDMDDDDMMDSLEMAMKWVAEEKVEDDSVCEPCRKNHGKTYKNREEAYKDYPHGEGYKDCVGAKFGNKCRGKVVKRRGMKDDA